MKKEDMTTAELLIEAIDIVITVIFCGLQIYYGFYYGYEAAIVQILMNVAAMLLAYAGLTMLQFHPETVNGLTPEACTPDIRTYTLRMLRIFKSIFVMSLLFTCILDVMGRELNPGYSLVVVVLIIAVAVFYESKILRILKDRRKK